MTLRYPADGLLAASRWFACGFAFSLPLSTSLMSVFLGLTIVSLALSGQYRRSYKAIFGNRFVVVALLLLALFGVGVLYSSSGHELALERLQKYAKLLLPALLFPIFLNSRMRLTAVYSFLAAMTLVLIAVYAMQLGLVREIPRGLGYSIHYSVDGGFKNRITTAIYMAFSAYGFLVLSGRVGRLKPLFRLLAALAAVHVLFLTSGLTGRLVLFALIGLTIVQTVGMKRGLAGFLVVSAVAFPVMYFGSDSFRGRVEDFRNMGGEVHEGLKSSVEQRMDYLKKGLALVASRPLVGHGTGAIVEEPVPGSGLKLLNLHNQYLMVWGEVGIAGLALLLYLFYTHWRLSMALPETERRLSQGVLVTMMVGCLVNSLITDAGEAHFYFFFSTLLLSQLADDGGAGDGRQAPG